MPQRDRLHRRRGRRRPDRRLPRATLPALDGVSRLTLADADAARARRSRRELGAQAAESPEALVEAGVDALVIATPTPGHAPLLAARRAAGLPAFCEKPVALELATLDDVIARSSAPGSSSRSASSGASTPATARRATRSPPARSATCSSLRAATHDPAPPPEDYIAELGRHLPRPAHPRLRRRALRDRRGDRRGLRRRRGARDALVRATTATSTPPSPCCASAAARSRSSPGTRHDPLGYDVRLEVFGTARQHRRRASTRAARSARSSPARRRPAARGYRDFMDRFEPAYRAELAAFVDAVRDGGREPCSLARGARRAARRPRRRPLARASGARSRSRRWLARKPSRVENRTHR